MTIGNAWHSKIVEIFRSILGEIGAGLIITWFIFLLLEVVRVTLVSSIVNLNYLLITGILLWLTGQEIFAPTWPRYVAAPVSAILIATVTFVLSPSSPFRVVLTGLTALVTYGLWFIAQMPNNRIKETKS